MSDAPERITVTIDDGSLFLEGEPTDEMIGRFWGHVEYVRADLFAELEAEVETLRSLESAVFAGRISLTRADSVGNKKLTWWGPGEQAE